MKVVILAGGYGTRIFEETISKPKPMIEIGGMPLLWHIMQSYSSFGHKEFIICLGYKKEKIINYFKDNFKLRANLFKKEKIENCLRFFDPITKWKITLVDTGINTMTGGRLKRVKNLIGNQTFFLSYGDTLSDSNILESLAFHRKNKALVTLTTIQPRSSYGVVLFNTNKDLVKSFEEKPIAKDHWINGGFYVIEPELIDLIMDDSISLEVEPFNQVVKMNKMFAFRHEGFWISVETYKDKLLLEDLWNENKAFWLYKNKNLGRVL